MPQFVLASTSPARLATLRAAGVEPLTIPSEVDEPGEVAREEAVLGRTLTTEEVVLLLARAKATAVLDRVRELGVTGAVFGGDSALSLGGETLGKPHLPEVARARIRAMRGTTGTLFSGHWMVRVIGGETVAEAGRTAGADVTFGHLTDAEIDAYVATGEPLEVAGSFTIDGLGSAFVERIVGDPSCVIGISMPTVRDLATQLGLFWPDFWSRGRHDEPGA